MSCKSGLWVFMLMLITALMMDDTNGMLGLGM